MPIVVTQWLHAICQHAHGHGSEILDAYTGAHGRLQFLPSAIIALGFLLDFSGVPFVVGAKC